MNFLEQLSAEWYEYKGYFVRTNVKFGKRKEGGYKGEMDVVAYNPSNREILHIETSTDSNSWPKRKKIFIKKFKDAKEHYLEIFPYKGKFKQMAIVGPNLKQTTESFGKSIEIKHIPAFLTEITEELKTKDPMKDAIPESYPLLRVVQYSAFYSNKLNKSHKK